MKVFLYWMAFTAYCYWWTWFWDTVDSYGKWWENPTVALSFITIIIFLFKTIRFTGDYYERKASRKAATAGDEEE